MKTKSIYSLFLILCLCSCSNQGNKIVSKIERECNTTSTKVINGIGTEIYTFDLPDSTAYGLSQKAKGIIDKITNTLPVKVSEGKFEWDGNIHDSYTWETPTIKIEFDFDFEKRGTDSVLRKYISPYYKMKIWITNK